MKENSGMLRPPLASFLGAYGIVFVGTGLAIVLVTAGVTWAVVALKREPASVSPLVPAETLANYPVAIVDPPFRPPATPRRPRFLLETKPATAPIQLLASVSAPPAIRAIAKKELVAIQPDKDNTCGTRIHFQSTPAVACKKALAENKLVFILHVSGNFEDPQFT